MTTRRQNLLDLLHGNKPHWTPCSINFSQWFGHNRRAGTLPPELGPEPDHLQAMKLLGCDIFSRNFNGGVREEPQGFEEVRRTEPGVQGQRIIEQIDTPHGTLRRATEEQPAISTKYAAEDLVKDWQREGKAYLWQLERRQFRWDRQAFERTRTLIGDDGVLIVAVGCTPLKRLHIDFGLDHACLFVLDEPKAAKTICDLYWQRLWPVLVELAGDPRVDVACLMDNLDTPFFPPQLCEHYWTPYVRQAADLFEQHGKRLMVHACGKLRQLKQVLRDSHVHGLEGMPHPPIGDFSPADVRDLRPGFIYNAGFSAHEQVTKSDDQVRSFYESFFREVDGYPQFVFGAACQTAITTAWPRIRMVVELCRQYGGAPN